MTIASFIDHTLLAPTATGRDIDTLCEEAATYGFASVCVQPMWVARATARLRGKSPAVCTVVGFPLGATTATSKAFETKEAIEHGATEIDMVLPIGALLEGDEETVRAHIRAVVRAANGILVKVIIETCLLTDEQKVRACQLAKEEGADYVKTSTGFSTGGATIDDIQLMRQTVGETLGVKASGGVRTIDEARAMIEAGATRIGASAGVSIVQAESK